MSVPEPCAVTAISLARPTKRPCFRTTDRPSPMRS